MMSGIIEDRAFWIALAHLPDWRSERINRLIARIVDERRLSFLEFFELGAKDWEHSFDLTRKECNDLTEAKADLPNLTLLAEDLMKQGFDMIPVRSREYPKLLKKNLRRKYCPVLLYTRGNKRLLQESTVAILGSEKASEAALQFAEAIAKRCSREHRVVVSGFAKGVNQTALDAALRRQGRGIVVLSQGIKTFSVGLKEYQAQIIDGDLLVVSPFFPKIPASTDLALARNSCIYGLSEEIYLAESNMQGGVTWSGAVEGLRNGRRVYVRKPLPGEENVNELLIAKGVVPVDEEGNPLPLEPEDQEAPLRQLHFNDLKDSFELRIRRYLSGLRDPISAREIKDQLKLAMPTNRLVGMLKGVEFVETTRSENGSPLFRLRRNQRA
jgi:predicted Rossmann fold nucleotide-binding protein DprA/Smf involved in DNA uptake